jgi:hypothetical protein
MTEQDLKRIASLSEVLAKKNNKPSPGSTDHPKVKPPKPKKK